MLEITHLSGCFTKVTEISQVIVSIPTYMGGNYYYMRQSLEETAMENFKHSAQSSWDEIRVAW